MKFLTGAPAMAVGKKLILAELHFGIELSLQRRGVNVNLEPRKYSETLNKLRKQSSTSELVVIGDFKHTVTGFDQRERNAFNEFVHQLEFEKITVVKGNHDSRLEEMAKPFQHFTVEPATGMQFVYRGASYGLFHGHAHPTEEVLESDVLLVGHNHAGVQIGSGEFGKTLQAWIVSPLKGPHRGPSTHGNQRKLIVFPSFNPLSGSIPFNVLKQRELHGPIFKNSGVDLENAEVILLSGQRIGKLKHLRVEK